MSTNVNVSPNKKFLTTSRIITIGMLSAVSFVLMLLEFPIPFLFPSFLKIDLSDIPAVIGTIAMGPLVGVIIELIKNLIFVVVKGTSSGYVGEIANFVVGISFMIPLGLVLKWSKNKRKVLIGLVAGLVSMTVIGAISNYFIFIPAYARVFGAPIDAFVEMSSAVNPMIGDFKTMILYAITPFNILKGIMISLLGYKLYNVLKGYLFNK